MISINKIWRCGIHAALAWALSGVVAAAKEPAASDWANTDQTQVRLVAAALAAGEAETVRLALQFKLAPGWKTYWRSPGDAGLPPRLDWSGSRNVAAAEIVWPAPERFELFGLDTFGYGGELVLPLNVRVTRPGAPILATLKLDYLVCEKICIPYEARLALDLPAGAARASEYAPLIDRAMARAPRDAQRAGITIERAEWNRGEAPSLTVVASAAQPFSRPDVFVEGPTAGAWAGIGFGKPEMFFSEGGKRATLRVPARPGMTAPPVDGAGFIGAPVTLTLVDGARAVEARTSLAAGLPSPPAPKVSLWWMAGVALLGGLILNLMPCVLPVLSLKLLGLVGHAGAGRTRVRRNFVASAAGILASFLALAATMIVLKGAGASIGWGVQFQQPVFIIFMALVLTLFAANLWDWLEFRAPSTLATGAAALAQGDPDRPESAWSAFLTGAFAALLATPCSAPFVGAAVGFALAHGATEILVIFGALAIGLAAPYLAVAAFPGLATRLPRPGSWMIRLRVILGAALAATAAWLVTVLGAQIGAQSALVLAAVLVALLGILAALRRAPRRAAFAAMAALALLAFVAPGRFAAAPAERLAGADGVWRNFDPGEIEAQLRVGRTVFIDITADWCLTCKVNKAAVLSRGEIAKRLADSGVTPMRADWTRPDDVIARYLARFSRYGVPFNVVYGPGAPSGIILPEILTTEIVRDALDRAASRVAAAPG